MLTRSCELNKKYSKAIGACNIVTQRLKCINRRLSEMPCSDKTLSEEVRTKVRTAYHEHLENCEDELSIII